MEYLNKIKAKILANPFVINYRKMWPFVKPVWFRALIALLICIPIGSLDAVIALSLKPYTDMVVVGKNLQSPWYIPLVIVAFTSLQGGLNYIANYLNMWVGGKITVKMKDALYKKLLSFEPMYFDNATSGEVMYRYNNDADNACNGLLNHLKTFVSRIFSSISLIGVLFYNSWQLAIVAVVVLIVAVAPLTKIKKAITTLVTGNNLSIYQLNTTYNETFAGNRTITSYNLQSEQSNKFKEILDAVFYFSVKMIQRTGWISPFMHFMVSIGIGVAIGFGSWLIVKGTITSGNFVSFLTALIMLYTPIKNLSGNVVALEGSMLAIERVFEVLEKEPAIKDKEDAKTLETVASSVKFKNITFEYVPNVPVLKDINLEVKAGETIALVGNSGGGKTTMVNLIPRFYDLAVGEILIDDKNIKDLTLKSLRDNIAVVFQDNFLFSGTIRQNVLLGNKNATESEIWQALDMAYLTEFVKGLENGLDTEIGERGILLSGGQKQRVAIARAFVKNAPIVILDEATSALDNKSEEIVQKAIDNLMKNKTVFVIAHRLSTVQNANRIAVINEGQMVELGSHAELMNIENGQYKNLYNMQFRKDDFVNA